MTIPVNTIVITRLEGPARLCDIPTTFSSFEDAQAWLYSQRATFSKLGVDKHNFSIEWEDGTIYTGRLDCPGNPNADPTDLDVHAHVLSQAQYMGGMITMSAARERSYREFLANVERSRLGSQEWHRNLVEMYL